MKKLLFVLAVIICLVSCAASSNSDSEKDKNTKSNGPELEVDKDNIRNLNNATDDEMTGWQWMRWEPGVGFPYSFSNGGMYTLNFDFDTGYKYVCVNGPASSYIFHNYFVIRKGSDGESYLIYYKEEDEDAVPPAGKSFVYKYCYQCYKYKLSDNYFKLEESDVIFDDVYNYVRDKM